VQEARFLGRRYRGVRKYISDSTRDAADARALAGPDVIHIATHLTVDDQSPWQLAIPSIVGSRGKAIRTGEIAMMDLRARLAVLSSCESAGGRVVSGEGVLGLSSAFLSAGVPTVVASLWPVSDLATARFMEHFYLAMEEGQSVVAALDAARRATRSEPETNHPFYWAGFVIVGDGETRVLLTRRPRFPWFVILVVLLVAGGVVVSMRRRRIRRLR
jgi:CHAT domain-containing protein